MTSKTSIYIIQLIDRSLCLTEKTAKKGRGHWGHRGRPGKRGGSLPSKGKAVTRVYFTEGQGAALVAGLDEDVREVAVEAIIGSGVIQEEHLTGMAPMTQDPPQRYDSWEDTPGWAGVYDDRENRIHINRDHRLGVDHIVTHELGHHYWETKASSDAKALAKEGFNRISDRMFDEIYGRRGAPSRDEWLAARGLRSYSMQAARPEEFMSDAFSVFIRGSSNQKQNLRESMGLSDSEFSRLFSEFGE